MKCTHPRPSLPSAPRSPYLTFGPNVLLATPLHAAALLTYACFPVFALKQLFSAIQLATALRRVVALDEGDRQ